VSQLHLCIIILINFNPSRAHSKQVIYNREGEIPEKEVWLLLGRGKKG
jgi:hypothetical protein